MSEVLVPRIPGITLPRPTIAASEGRHHGRRVSAPMTDRSGLDGLIDRLQRRDDTALEAFILATQDKAYRLAFSILGDHDRCQDALQDAYLTVYQKIDQLQNAQALRGWFSQILINRCRQELRGRRLESLDDLPADREPGEDGMADGVHQRLEVQEALLQLPAPDRAVLSLREVWQLSYQEISESLKVPLGTVRSRIFNARQRLLAALSGSTPQRRSTL